MFFNRAGKADVTGLLDEFHYIGARVAEPMYVFVWRKDGGLFGGDGEISAAAVFSQPVARAWVGGIELSRLVRADDLSEPLTKFLGCCLRYLKKVRRHEYAIAYADPGAGHHGGIYQAGNWQFIGMSSPKTKYIHNTTGRELSQRSFDQSAQNKANYNKTKTPAKYTYAYPLTVASRKWIEGKALPFPKPGKQKRLDP